MSGYISNDDVVLYTDDIRGGGVNGTSTSSTPDNSMPCPLCAITDDHNRRLLSALIPVAFPVALLLAFVCVWCKKCRWRRSPRGRDSITNSRSRSVREIEVPRGNDNVDDAGEDLDVSRQLGRMRRMQIISSSLVTTKAVLATTIRLSPSSVDLVSQNGKGDDPLKRTEHTESTEDDSSSTGNLSLDKAIHARLPRCGMKTRRSTMETETSSCTSLDDMSIKDEEEGMQSTSLDDDDLDSRKCETDSTLILESTGWEIDACAICLESYKENDLVSSSKKKNCAHVFHKKCIVLWLMGKEDCPCCRCPYL